MKNHQRQDDGVHRLADGTAAAGRPQGCPRLVPLRMHNRQHNAAVGGFLLPKLFQFLNTYFEM